MLQNTKSNICVFVLVLGAVPLHSDILKVLECHDQIVSQGTNTLLIPRQVESLFGSENVDHFISGFGDQKSPPVWNSVAYFGNRYTFSLQMPIVIEHDKCKLIGVTNSAMIQINEVIKVEISSSGIAGARMKGQWRLNESDWNKLAKSGGDWSVVGIPIVTNSPVKGFEEYARQAREPIRNRKQGFDIPIREALGKLRTQARAVSDKREEEGAEPTDLYEKVIRDGSRRLSFPRELSALFGATNVDHFVSNFGIKANTPVWHSITHFADRYRLLVRVPLSIDYEKRKFLGAENSVIVRLTEITAVDPSTPTLAGAVNGKQWLLSENEWKFLVKNEGDWSAVKVSIRTNAPVEGFEQYVREERRRPPRIREGDFVKSIKSDFE